MASKRKPTASVKGGADLQSLLRPYQSYHVFKDPLLSKPEWGKSLSKLLDEILALARHTPGEAITVVEGPRLDEVPQGPSGLRLGWLTYTKELSAAWADEDAEIRDTE